SQLRAGLESELLDQNVASDLEGTQRVGLPSCAVQSDHELAAQPLPQRVGGNEGFKFDDAVVDPAEGDVEIDALLDHRQTQLHEAGDRGLRELLVREVCERVTAP